MDDEYDYYNDECEVSCMVAAAFVGVVLMGTAAAAIWAIIKLAGWHG